MHDYLSMLGQELIEQPLYHCQLSVFKKKTLLARDFPESYTPNMPTLMDVELIFMGVLEKKDEPSDERQPQKVWAHLRASWDEWLCDAELPCSDKTTFLL